MKRKNLRHQWKSNGDADYNSFAVKWFTMIELLVVIAIIAILAAILLPALDKAKKMVQVTACTNNLKQLAQCSFFYADDYGGYFPTAGGGTSDWSFKLIPYFSPTRTYKSGVKATGALTLCWCPATTLPPKWDYFPVSYGQNHMLAAYPIRSNFNNRLSRTSSIILHMDSDDTGAVSGTMPSTLSAHRHNGRWNSSFLDGHVEIIDIGKVSNALSYY